MERISGWQNFTINQKKDEILKGIFRRKPEVLCISCYIWNISLVRELIREIHKILPDTAIWLGGPEVSYDGEKVLQECPEVTGVMKGEGGGNLSGTGRTLSGKYCGSGSDSGDNVPKRTEDCG